MSNIEESELELPPEIDIDLSVFRGEVEFIVANENTLGTEDGVKRMRWYVRNYKKKEGETAFEELFKKLVDIAGEDCNEEGLRSFMTEADGCDFDDLGLTFNNMDHKKKVEFFDEFKTIGWLEKYEKEAIEKRDAEEGQ